MTLSKNMEYIVSGLVVAYIVFMTRPAPGFVVTVLSSPVAQIVALALVVLVGAKYSLMIAVVLALAVVLSIPAREHMTNSQKKETEAHEGKKAPENTKKPAPSLKKTPAAMGKKEPEHHEEPEAAGHTVDKPTGKETFSLQNAAAF
jgi:hypothetical protein